MARIVHNPAPGAPLPSPVKITHNVDVEGIRRQCEEDWSKNPDVRAEYASLDDYIAWQLRCVNGFSRTID